MFDQTRLGRPRGASVLGLFEVGSLHEGLLKLETSPNRPKTCSSVHAGPCDYNHSRVVALDCTFGKMEFARGALFLVTA
jgi:hypothetical protein